MMLLEQKLVFSGLLQQFWQWVGVSEDSDEDCTDEGNYNRWFISFT
jgi:hypothetical protein